MKSLRTFTLSQKDINQLGFFTQSLIKKIQFSELVDNTNLLKENYALLLRDGKNYFVPQLLKKILHKNIILFIDVKYTPIIYTEIIKATWIVFFSNNLETSSKELQEYIYPIKPVLKKNYSIAVTGTNGKTSTTQFIYDVLKKQKQKCTYIGTLGTLCNDERLHTKLTTPSLLTNKKIWYQSYQRDIPYIVMEVSSHAIKQKRLEGLEWDIIIFTNLTEEHLDYHKTMKQYYIIKRKLFFNLFRQKVKIKPHIIINTDDKYGKKLLTDILKFQNRCKNKFSITTPQIITLGKNNSLTINNINPQLTGYTVDFSYKNEKYFIKSKLLGIFNIYNLLSALLASHILQPLISIQNISSILETVLAPTGRMLFISNKNKNIIIDYAHTPNALENIFITVLELCIQNIFIIFGCGGERYQEKRQIMGQIADKYASHIILTNDNPRNENQDIIISHIREGISLNKEVIIELDRKNAIKRGLDLIQSNDILLIIGKGHETVQVIKNREYPFSDIKIVNELLQ